MGVRVRLHKGEYYVFINYKMRRKAIRGGSEEDAEYIATGIRTALASGNFEFDDEVENSKSSITLKKYFEHVDKKHLTAALSESTVDAYESNFKLHVGPSLGDLQLSEIDRTKVKEFVADLIGKGLKRPSIRKITAELCAMLNRAIEDGYIAANPAARMSKFFKHAKEREEPILPFSPEEVPKFLQAVRKHYPYYLPVFVTFIHAGLRAGELAALRWSDVDFENRWLNVRSAISRGKVGKTKTGKIRKVDMSDLVITVLKAWKIKQEKRYGDLPESVFTNHEGGRLDTKNLYHRAWKGSLNKAKLAHRRLHDLRHTFATLLIMNGESLAYVRDQLGHSSIMLTVDTYTHWIPGSNRQAVNKLPGMKSTAKKIIPFKKAQ